MTVLEIPWERAGVIAPGLPILPHGVERHPVPGGGTRALPIYKGDENRQALKPKSMLPIGRTPGDRKGPPGHEKSSKICEHVTGIRQKGQ